ncbi:MAG: hypothetical protein P8N03_07585 [Arenicellales bacterium]|nr:hypothetical protein [Arenicellales bacterium]
MKARTAKNGTCLLAVWLTFFSSITIADLDQEQGALLRAIQGLQSLRYEILQEQARFDSMPRPTSQDELKVWKAIEQDMTMTLAEIDQSLSDYQRQYSELTDSAKAPPAAKMPPLLPD